MELYTAFWLSWMLLGCLAVVLMVFLVRYFKWRRLGYRDEMVELFAILKDNSQEAITIKKEIFAKVGLNLKDDEVRYPAVEKYFEELGRRLLLEHLRTERKDEEVVVQEGKEGG